MGERRGRSESTVVPRCAGFKSGRGGKEGGRDPEAPSSSREPRNRCPGGVLTTQAQRVLRASRAFGFPPYVSTAAVVDSRLFWAPGVLRTGAPYDLVSGTLLIYKDLGPLRTAYSIAREAYDVTGVAPGTPVALTAELVADGAASTPGCGASGCGGTFGASIRHGADYQVRKL